MSDQAIGLLGLASLLILIGLRIPIGVALISVSFVGIWQLMGWTPAWGALGLIPFQFTNSWILSSVPMFLFMGFVCFHAELTRGLFHAAKLWLAALPGGLAIATIFGSAGFAAVSGSSIACSAAMGRVAVPEMLRARYDAQMATGCVAVAGTIGALIPPSIILILYGVIAQVSITRLFLGGIAAGVITAIGYSIVVLIRVRLNPALAPNPGESFSFQERLNALKETWPVLSIALLVFGGLFGGVFTPTEAGAVGSFLVCAIGLLRGSLNWQRFRAAAVESILTTAALVIIGVGASLFSRFLALSGTGDLISQFVINLGAEQITILLGIVLIYVVLGMILDPISAMLLTLPVVLPIVADQGWSLLWFGIVLTKLLEIGMLTPPIGMNVFVVKSVVGKLATTAQIYRGIIWFLVMDFVILALLIAFPAIILFLPTKLG